MEILRWQQTPAEKQPKISNAKGKTLLLISILFIFLFFIFCASALSLKLNSTLANRNGITVKSTVGCGCADFVNILNLFFKPSLLDRYGRMGKLQSIGSHRIWKKHIYWKRCVNHSARQLQYIHMLWVWACFWRLIEVLNWLYSIPFIWSSHNCWLYILKSISDFTNFYNIYVNLIIRLKDA